MTEAELPVLIFAPGGRDAAVAAAILGEAGIAIQVCASLADVVSRLDTAACAILTEEALLSSNRQALADWIAAQPPWSDFPFILLRLRGAEPNAQLTDMLGNVSVLERPFHPATLVMAARSAHRAKRRQLEARAYLEERERTTERQALLIRELHHRVKNTLATVQALLGASARSATSVDAFYASFSARVISLAKTHNLLTEDYWQQAPLRDMLMNELGPYNDVEGARIQLDGPAIDLMGDLAVPTGMAIHELTTNAAKHGALSVPEGRIAVRWDIEQTPAARLLHLDWTERGGPATAAPTRKGFGSTLLQRVLKVQCQAEIAFDFQPAGLHFTMRAPLPETRVVPAY
ncbi:histidine kinase [Methylobacterium radiotolerans]|nr:histidine kinase [Methylobacterium radiotolerans]KTS47415.1 histidine kinase [Methylobacterium radiotolerans]